MDRVSPEARSRIMRAIRSRWTRQERLFASLAPGGWERGGPAEGSADFVYRGPRVAVFLDGDFWHGRRVPESLPEPWKVKLARNAERDGTVRSGLEARGWAVLSYWESDFLADPEAAVREVMEWIMRRASFEAQEDQ
jgi:DNA mismatch endonuclease (patch repair protein)